MMFGVCQTCGHSVPVSFLCLMTQDFSRVQYLVHNEVIRFCSYSMAFCLTRIIHTRGKGAAPALINKCSEHLTFVR